jgi:hypothetical protein
MIGTIFALCKDVDKLNLKMKGDNSGKINQRNNNRSKVSN